MTIFEDKTSPDKFIYMVVARLDTDVNSESLALNNLGVDGWELIAVATYGQMRWLYFRKKHNQ